MSNLIFIYVRYENLSLWKKMLIIANIARTREPEPNIFSEPQGHKMCQLICSRKEKFNMLIQTHFITFLVNLFHDCVCGQFKFDVYFISF